MKLVLVALILCLSFFQFDGMFSRKAQATPLLLVPPVAIGSLEVLAATAAVAATAGVISVAQNEEFQRNISEDIERIKTLSKEAIDALVADAVLIYQKISGQNQCSSTLDQQRRGSCSENIEACCHDFFVKFQKRAHKGKGGIQIFHGKNKLDCCLEWDYIHGGLEIFDDRGRHLGERGCDDLSDDPCEWTKSRGKHAEPASATHHPRTPACQP